MWLEQGYRIGSIILITLLSVGPVQARGRKPKKEEPKSTLKETKETANDALNSVDKTVHDVIGPAKKAANKALQSVDDAVHGRK